MIEMDLEESVNNIISCLPDQPLVIEEVDFEIKRMFMMFSATMHPAVEKLAK